MNAHKNLLINEDSSYLGQGEQIFLRQVYRKIVNGTPGIESSDELLATRIHLPVLASHLRMKLSVD